MLEILEGFLYPARVRVEADLPELPASWNIKPTQAVRMAFMAGGDLVGSVARWWFVPQWHRRPVEEWTATTFNARIETAAEKATFRAAWEGARCVIPAQGYFEWTGPKARRQPWFIGVQSNAPMVFFAGLYATREGAGHSAAILTRPALPQIAHIHPRTPVILTEEEIAPWMRHEIGAEAARAHLGTGWDGRMRFHPVARFGRDDDGPDLIAPEGLAL